MPPVWSWPAGRTPDHAQLKNELHFQGISIFSLGTSLWCRCWETLASVFPTGWTNVANKLLIAKLRMVKAGCAHGIAGNPWRMNVEIIAPAKPVWMVVWLVLGDSFAAIRRCLSVPGVVFLVRRIWADQNISSSAPQEHGAQLAWNSCSWGCWE